MEKVEVWITGTTKPIVKPDVTLIEVNSTDFAKIKAMEELSNEIRLLRFSNERNK